MRQFDGIFDNQMVVEIFLYCVQSPQGLSIREAQRDLGVPNTSTIHWHLAKLVEVNLVEQVDDDKRYYLTSLGRSINKVEIPIRQQYFLFRGELYPITVFQLSFLVSTLVISGLLFKINRLTSSIFMFMVLTVLAIQNYRMIKKYGKRFDIDTKAD